MKYIAHRVAFLLLSPLIVVAKVAHSDVCIEVGATRTAAQQNHQVSCGTNSSDCDRHNGNWYCAAESIGVSDIEAWLISRTPDQNPDRIAEADEVNAVEIDRSASPCVDPDGDGWGWDGSQSCRVTVAESSADVIVPARAAGLVTDNVAVCNDSDGDGWGWDGTKSCRVLELNRSTSDDAVIQPRVERVQSTESGGSCSGSYSPADITDLILVTGQSNVTGANTEISATIDQYGRVVRFHEPDKSHPRVFAWTVDPRDNNGTGWKVASLNQSWHDSAPGVGGIARNNFAFHFAKQVASRSKCKVVGFVMVSEGGKGIAHWDNGATGWIEVNRQVHDAMSAIGRSSIDGVLWHQGESDWIYDGTCFNTPRCRNNIQDYYPQKLFSGIADSSVYNPVGRNALIDRLRRQSWFSNGKPFIAGETVQAPVNAHLNKLNSDRDNWTACVRGDLESGIGIRSDDPHRNHYSGEGLRELGARYATEYLKMITR